MCIAFGRAINKQDESESKSVVPLTDELSDESCLFMASPKATHMR